MRIEYASNWENIVVNDEEVEDLEEFPYLGTIVDEEGDGSKDIKNRM